MPKRDYFARCLEMPLCVRRIVRNFLLIFSRFMFQHVASILVSYIQFSVRLCISAAHLTQFMLHSNPRNKYFRKAHSVQHGVYTPRGGAMNAKNGSINPAVALPPSRFSSQRLLWLCFYDSHSVHFFCREPFLDLWAIIIPKQWVFRSKSMLSVFRSEK